MCILRGALRGCSLVSLRAELGPKVLLCFIGLNTLPFQGDCQLLCDHEKIDFNFSEH